MRCVRARPSLAERWRHTNRDRSCEVCSCPYLFQWRSLREPWMREAWGAPSPDKPPRTLSVVGGGSAAGPSHSRTFRNERPHRQDITVWRRDDADDALRSSPEHAGAFDEMVLAQGLGDEDCQAPRDEEGDRCPGASVGRDHASHLGRWHRIPMDQGGRRSNQIRENLRSAQRWNDVPRGTMDEVSSYGRLNLQAH